MTKEERKIYNREYKKTYRKTDKYKNYMSDYQKTDGRKVYMTEYWKTYRENNKDSINEYRRNKRNTYPLFKLQTNIRTLISQSIQNNGYTKRSKINDILGCTYTEFKAHLEAKFESWMSWDNYGKYEVNSFNVGWDIDHVIPLASATNEESVIALNHYTNLQPLCSKVNRDVKRDTV